MRHKAEWMDEAFAARLYELDLVASGQAALTALEIETREAEQALRRARGEQVYELQGYCNGLERLAILMEQAKKVTQEATQ